MSWFEIAIVVDLSLAAFVGLVAALIAAFNGRRPEDVARIGRNTAAMTALFLPGVVLTLGGGATALSGLSSDDSFAGLVVIFGFLAILVGGTFILGAVAIGLIARRRPLAQPAAVMPVEAPRPRPLRALGR